MSDQPVDDPKARSLKEQVPWINPQVLLFFFHRGMDLTIINDEERRHVDKHGRSAEWGTPWSILYVMWNTARLQEWAAAHGIVREALDASPGTTALIYLGHERYVVWLEDYVRNAIGPIRE
jgi:hypothetical protein